MQVKIELEECNPSEVSISSGDDEGHIWLTLHRVQEGEIIKTLTAEISIEELKWAIRKISAK